MRPIKFNDQIQKKILQDFASQLAKFKLSSDKLQYTYEINKKDVPETRKPQIYITPSAYCKMNYLISRTDDEIGWHGLVERKENIFYIYDILVYPQAVTGTTITPDQEEYNKWLMEQPDDIFCKIRMQGHSHVNMAPRPSTVDENYYHDLLQTLKDTDFYIFMIVNKKQELEIMLYDLSENMFYDKNDLFFNLLLTDNSLLKDWHTEQMKKVVKKTYTAPVTQISTHEKFPVNYWDRDSEEWYKNYPSYSQYSEASDKFKSKEKEKKKNEHKQTL